MALIEAQEVNNTDQVLAFIAATLADSYENFPGAVLLIRNTHATETRVVTIPIILEPLFDAQAGVISQGNIFGTVRFGEDFLFVAPSAYSDEGGIVTVGYDNVNDLEVAVIHVKN